VTVVVFLSTSCPIANGALVRLDALARDLARDTGVEDDVRIYGVVSDRSVTRAHVAAHYEERPTGFPILFDASGMLREALGPTHVPEAFVFDAAGRLAYRGAIDDAFAAVGRRRPAVTSHHLADAIAVVRRGRPDDR